MTQGVAFAEILFLSTKTVVLFSLVLDPQSLVLVHTLAVILGLMYIYLYTYVYIHVKRGALHH